MIKIAKVRNSSKIKIFHLHIAVKKQTKKGFLKNIPLRNSIRAIQIIKICPL
jgi:hypothetical protein